MKTEILILEGGSMAVLSGLGNTVLAIFKFELCDGIPTVEYELAQLGQVHTG